MVAVPAATPVITPDVEFTVAIDVLEEEKVPPEVVELNVVVKLMQTVLVPVKAFTVGFAFTVTPLVTVVVQPLPLVTA